MRTMDDFDENINLHDPIENPQLCRQGNCEQCLEYIPAQDGHEEDCQLGRLMN